MPRRQSSAAVLLGNNGLLRGGISEILRSADFRILSSVSAAEQLRLTKPDFSRTIFLVIHTGEDFGAAVDQVRFLRNFYPPARIALVVDHYSADEVTLALEAGANAYFVELTSHAVFVKSIELVLLGETVLPALAHARVHQKQPEIPARRKTDQPAVARADSIARQLSSREMSILRCLVDGDSNKQIARRIAIAEATVKVHIKAILRKIQVSNRTQAAIWGMNELSMRPPLPNPSALDQSGTVDDSKHCVADETPPEFAPAVIQHTAHNVLRLDRPMPRQRPSMAKHFGE